MILLKAILIKFFSHFILIMKKHIVFIFCFFVLHTLPAFSLEMLDTDFCKNGHGAPWIGACICDNPTVYTGRYCDVRTTGSCHSNKECSKDSFCLQSDGIGACTLTTGQGPIVINNVSFIISDMLLNYQSAERFCSSYTGGGYRQASRADFSCSDIGPACLDTDIVITLQEHLGTRGFFWLDSKDETNAYYADMNDGTVYETSKQNFKTIQALCIKKEQ